MLYALKCVSVCSSFRSSACVTFVDLLFLHPPHTHSVHSSFLFIGCTWLTVYARSFSPCRTIHVCKHALLYALLCFRFVSGQARTRFHAAFSTAAMSAMLCVLHSSSSSSSVFCISSTQQPTAKCVYFVSCVSAVCFVASFRWVCGSIRIEPVELIHAECHCAV